MKKFLLFGAICFSLNASAQMFCHTDEKNSDCMEVSYDAEYGEVIINIHALCDDGDCEEYEAGVMANQQESLSELVDIFVTVENGTVTKVVVTSFDEKNCCAFKSGVYLEGSQGGTNSTNESCYHGTTETLDETIRISISQDNKVSGTIDASIEDDENGYYTTYGGDFSGELLGDKLHVTATMEIEGDVQEYTEIWILNKETGTLIKGNFVHQLTKCQ